jgi:hypothetical protein
VRRRVMHPLVLGLPHIDRFVPLKHDFGFRFSQ